MNPRRWLAFIALALLTVAAHAVTPGKILLVTQSVSAPGEGTRATVDALEATALWHGHALSLDQDGRTVPHASSIAHLPVFDFGTARTSAQIIAEAKRWTRDASSVVALGLARHITPRGIGIGVFQLRQRVQVSGSADPYMLTWQLVVHGAGTRPVYHDPRLEPIAASALQISYWPLRLPPELSSSVREPNAGSIEWRTLDHSGTPVTAWARIDVGGAYDEPDPTTGRVDLDAGWRCLLRRSTGCPDAANAQDIMAQAGFAGAIVDYRRNVAIDTEVRPAAPGSDAVVHVARASVSIVERSVTTTAGCTGGAYSNRGTWGVALRHQVERFRADVTGDYQRIGLATGVSTLAGMPYHHIRPLDRGDTVASLSDRIIDPTDPSRPLRHAADVPGRASLPPIRRSGTDAGETHVIADYHHGACGRAAMVRARCTGTGQIELEFGTSGEVPHCRRGTGFNGAPVRATLTPGVPTPARIDHILDYPGTIRWMFDGERVVFLPPAPGEPESTIVPGSSIYASLLFFPSLGYHQNEHFPGGGPVSFYFAAAGCPAGQQRGGGLTPAVEFGAVPDPDTCYAPIGEESGGARSIVACDSPPDAESRTCRLWDPTGPATYHLRQR